MIERDYYLLKQAAEILNCSEDDLIHLGVKGVLPIYILTAKFYVKGVIYAYGGGWLEGAPRQGYNNSPYMRLAKSCLAQLEAGGEHVEVELVAEPYYQEAYRDGGFIGPIEWYRLDQYDHWGRRHIGWHSYELFLKNAISQDPRDLAKLFSDDKITLDQYVQGIESCAPPIQVKDCKLVILHDDLKRLQEPGRKPDAALTVNDRVGMAKLKINEQRNEIAEKWLAEENRDLDAMKNKEIVNALEAFSRTFKTEDGEQVYKRGIFTSGGEDWLNRDHSVIPKRKAGNKPRK